MAQHGFRLERGADLRAALCEAAQGLDAAVPIACVGSLSRWRLRCADGATVLEGAEPVEIVSLTGTVSRHGCHLHIALAREDLSVIGGHLMDGCIVHTTAEIVLLGIDGVMFTRAHDPRTGYRELVIRPKP